MAQVSKRQRDRINAQIKFLRGLLKNGWKLKTAHGLGGQSYNELMEKVDKEDYIVTLVFSKRGKTF